MEKVICLLWAHGNIARDRFNAALLTGLATDLRAAGASAIRMNLEDGISAQAAHLRQVCSPAQHGAAVQFWLPSANHLFRSRIDAALSRYSARWCGWVVAESTIIANSACPPAPGARTDGFAQLAFLTIPDRLSRAQWLALWQDSHTQVAIETQANFEYVQNVIVRPLTADGPDYAAIVEECFPVAALRDPLAFFDAEGDRAKFDRNLGRMMESCDRFIDRGTIDVVPTGQYHP